jgi:hypothetical protein
MIRRCVDCVKKEEILRRSKEGLLEEMNKRFDVYKSKGIKVSMYNIDNIYYLVDKTQLSR